MYKGKNGRERYPGFKLYRMIARKVHNHTPQHQLNRACFQTFVVDANLYQEKGDSVPFYRISGHTFPLRSIQIEGPKLGNVSSKRFEPQSGYTRLLQ